MILFSESVGIKGPRFLVVLAALGVVTLAVFSSFLPLGGRVAIIWVYLLLAPGWAAHIDERVTESSQLTQLGSMVLLSLLWDLVILFFFSVAGIGLHWGFWILVGSGPILALTGNSRGTESVNSPKQTQGFLRRAIPVVLLVLVGVWVARQPAQIRLDSDIPAHMGAIRDAQLENRWIPWDRSFPGSGHERDPRMGLFHGLHASIAVVLDSDPGEVWVRSGSVLSPFFILAFACLFAELGLGLLAAFLTSCVFAAGAGQGKALGIWGAIYPAQAALAMGALSWAWFLNRMEEGRNDATGMAAWWVGALALGVSVLIHPFAWWAYCLVLAHMTLLLLVLRRRFEAFQSLRFLVVSGVLGAILLVPVLRNAAAITHGAHWQPAGVLFFGSRFFTLDPAILLRWSGWSAPLSLAMALVLWKRWGTNWRSIAVLSTTLPLWTIALNPLLQPSIYARVGYLSERLGLVAIGPAILLLALTVPVHQKKTLFRRSASMIVLGGLLWSSLPAWANSPYRANEETRALVKALSAARLRLRGPVLSDPLSSYVLRATTTVVPVLLPVAHASPLDATLSNRLAGLRAILSPDTPSDHLAELLRASGGGQLLITHGLESLYTTSEYGFVPRNVLQARLRETLNEEVAAVVDQSTVMTLYDIRSGKHGQSPAESSPMQGAATATSTSEVDLRGLTLGDQVLAPGDSLHVRALFGGCMTEAGPWTTVELGIVIRSTAVPRALQPLSKLYRKVILQKSLRSNDRFLFRWIPGDGYRCPQGEWVDLRSFQVPGFLRPGEYSVFARMKSPPWRRNRGIEDYLNDRGMWSGSGEQVLILRKRGG